MNLIVDFPAKHSSLVQCTRCPLHLGMFFGSVAFVDDVVVGIPIYPRYSHKGGSVMPSAWL